MILDLKFYLIIPDYAPAFSFPLPPVVRVTSLSSTYSPSTSSSRSTSSFTYSSISSPSISSTYTSISSHSTSSNTSTSSSTYSSISSHSTSSTTSTSSSTYSSNSSQSSMYTSPTYKIHIHVHLVDILILLHRHYPYPRASSFLQFLTRALVFTFPPPYLKPQTRSNIFSLIKFCVL